MTRVVGLLKWEDFVKEIRRAQPRAVRAQAYHITRGTEPPLMEFFLDVAFADGDEILLARFPPHRREQFHQRMRAAEEILRGALAALEVEVLPGVYVAAQDARVETSPAGLWRWEKDGDALRLIPEIPVEAAA